MEDRKKREIKPVRGGIGELYIGTRIPPLPLPCPSSRFPVRPRAFTLCKSAYVKLLSPCCSRHVRRAFRPRMLGLHREGGRWRTGGQGFRWWARERWSHVHRGRHQGGMGSGWNGRGKAGETWIWSPGMSTCLRVKVSCRPRTKDARTGIWYLGVLSFSSWRRHQLTCVRCPDDRVPFHESTPRIQCLSALTPC